MSGALRWQKGTTATTARSEERIRERFKGAFVIRRIEGGRGRVVRGSVVVARGRDGRGLVKGVPRGVKQRAT